MKLKLAFIKNNIEEVKELYKDILSSSSIRYCLVYYVTLLPGLLIYGVERVKDSSIAYGYFVALTTILGLLLGFKVKQYGKEVGDAIQPLDAGKGKDL
jgi:hypothetical protein